MRCIQQQKKLYSYLRQAPREDEKHTLPETERKIEWHTLVACTYDRCLLSDIYSTCLNHEARWFLIFIFIFYFLLYLSTTSLLSSSSLSLCQLFFGFFYFICALVLSLSLLLFLFWVSAPPSSFMLPFVIPFAMRHFLRVYLIWIFLYYCCHLMFALKSRLFFLSNLYFIFCYGNFFICWIFSASISISTFFGNSELFFTFFENLWFFSVLGNYFSIFAMIKQHAKSRMYPGMYGGRETE